MTPEEIWNSSLSKIEERIGSSFVDLWFRPIKLAHVKEQQVTLDIPNRFFKDWIEDNYPDIVAESIGGVLGYAVNVRFRIAEKIDPDVKKMDMRLETAGRNLRAGGFTSIQSIPLRTLSSVLATSLPMRLQRKLQRRRAEHTTPFLSMEA
jgi:chromosomal replication initiation ATPase DnaA